MFKVEICLLKHVCDNCSSHKNKVRKKSGKDFYVSVGCVYISALIKMLQTPTSTAVFCTKDFKLSG